MTLQARGSNARSAVRVTGGVTAVASSLANNRVWRTGGDDIAYAESFQAVITGNVLSRVGYWEQGSGYAGGDGGVIRIRVYPDDGTTSHYPDMSGSPLAESTFTPALSGGVWDGAAKTRQSNSLSFSTVSGQIYHIVHENIATDPASDYISLNSTGAIAGLTTDQQQWTDNFGFRILYGKRTGTTGPYTWADQSHAPVDTSVMRIPCFSLTYADGRYDGLLRAEMATAENRHRVATNAAPVRTLYSPSRSKRIGGWSAFLGFKVPGSMLVQIKDSTGTVLRSWTVTESTAYSTLTLGSAQVPVPTMRDASFDPLDVAQGQDYYIEYTPQGSAEVSFGQILDWRGYAGYGAALTEFTAQHYSGGSWINYYWNNPTVDAGLTYRGFWQDGLHEEEIVGTTIDIDRLVYLMTNPSEVQPMFGVHSNSQAKMQCPNFDALYGMCRQGGRVSVLDDYANATATWFWAYPATGHSAWTKRLQARGLRVSIKRKSDGVWVDAAPGATPSTNKYWNGNTDPGWTNQRADYRDHGADGGSWLLGSGPGGTSDGVEAWSDTFYSFNNRALIVDCAAIAVGIEVRVINDDGTPYYGSDARFAALQGFDIYNANRNTPGSGSAGELKDAAGYPKDMMDGGNCMWSLVTGGDWQSIAVITMDPYQDATGIPPWAGYEVQWTWNDPPYVLTEAQVRAAGGVPTWVTGGDGGTPTPPPTYDGAKRYNFALQSENLADAAWTKNSATVTTKASPPSPLSAWQTLAVTASGSGYGATQHFATLPAGQVTFSFIAAPEATDWVAVRLVSADWSKGVWMYFNANAGLQGPTVYYQGGFSGATAMITPNPAGGYVIAVTCTTDSTGWGVEIYPCGADGEFDRTSGDSINIGGFQMETGPARTHYKPSTSAVIERTITTVNDGLSPASVASNGSAGFTVTVLDDTGAPWDQFSGISLASSNQSVATVGAIAAPTNASGTTAAAVTAIAAGTTVLTAAAGGVTSAGETLTVTASGITLAAPTGITVTVGNGDAEHTSDTVSISVSGVDASATDARIEYRLAGAGEWLEMMTLSKTAFPVVFEGLAPGSTYDVRAFSVLNNEWSDPSATATVTMDRLFVLAHFHPEAVGVSGAQVTVGRGANPLNGLLVPTEILATRTGVTLDGPVTYQGQQWARAIVVLSNQPVGVKLRDGDLVDAVVMASVGGKSFQSKILHGMQSYGALVREAP